MSLRPAPATTLGTTRRCRAGAGVERARTISTAVRFTTVTCEFGALSVPLTAKIPQGALCDVSRVITVPDKCLAVAQYPNFVDHRKAVSDCVTEIRSYFHPDVRE